MYKKTRRFGLGVSLLALALTSAACGTGSDDAAVGENQATGKPILVGYINQEQAASGSFPDLRKGTEAAVEHVNGDLGGVDGRPIELIQCITNGSPESSQKCANKMVESKVVLVLSGIDYGGPSAYEVVSAAGIPYVPTQPIQGPDFNGKNVFAFLGSSPGQFAGEAKYIEQQGYKSVAIIINDTPAGHEGAAILKADLQEKGIQVVSEVSESPSATDFTAAVTAAAKNNPDAISVMFVAPACGQIMQTAKSLEIKAQLVFTTSCLTPTVLESVGDAAEGVVFMQELLPLKVHADDPEVKAFTDAMAKYKKVEAAKLSSLNQNGFAVAMTLVGAISKSGSEPTPQSIIDTLKSAKGEQRGFMDDGYRCDSTVLPKHPSICNASVRVVTVKDGQQVEVTKDWLN